MENKNNNNYLLPVSIIIAAALIAGAWIYTSGLKNLKIDQTGKNQQKKEQISENINNLKQITSDDHIFGNPDASVKIVEYSDLECPFCKVFHQTMKQAMSLYAQNGKVAWVYRHYPLVGLHSKSMYSAQASECAAELGGNDKFWAFIDKYFEITPSNDKVDLSQLPNIAQDIGLDKVKFEECLNSGKYEQKVKDEINDAQNLGARGTPYSIVVSKDGKKYEISGAYPLEQVKAIINQAL